MITAKHFPTWSAKAKREFLKRYVVVEELLDTPPTLRRRWRWRHFCRMWSADPAKLKEVMSWLGLPSNQVTTLAPGYDLRGPYCILNSRRRAAALKLGVVSLPSDIFSSVILFYRNEEDTRKMHEMMETMTRSRQGDVPGVGNVGVDFSSEARPINSFAAIGASWGAALGGMFGARQMRISTAGAGTGSTEEPLTSINAEYRGPSADITRVDEANTSPVVGALADLAAVDAMRLNRQMQAAMNAQAAADVNEVRERIRGADFRSLHANPNVHQSIDVPVNPVWEAQYLAVPPEQIDFNPMDPRIDPRSRVRNRERDHHAEDPFRLALEDVARTLSREWNMNYRRVDPSDYVLREVLSRVVAEACRDIRNDMQVNDQNLRHRICEALQGIQLRFNVRSRDPLSPLPPTVYLEMLVFGRTYQCEFHLPS